METTNNKNWNLLIKDNANLKTNLKTFKHRGHLVYNKEIEEKIEKDLPTMKMNFTSLFDYEEYGQHAFDRQIMFFNDVEPLFLNCYFDMLNVANDENKKIEIAKAYANKIRKYYSWMFMSSKRNNSIEDIYPRLIVF